MNFFKSNPQVLIYLGGSEGRPRKNVRQPGADPIEMQLYSGAEIVSGSVEISAPSGKKVEYKGIKLEFLGQVELPDRGGNHCFLASARVLEAAQGIMSSSKTYPFEFSNEKIHESYAGLNVRLRYFLRVVIERPYNVPYTKELDIAVENCQNQVELQNDKPNKPIKLEVGIEECLHIEFEYDRGRYHLEDVILGKIFFLLVRIKIKHMELAVIRRESCGAPGNSGAAYNDSENIIRYELMDGAPIKGECVPIRLFLGPLALTPTYRSIANMFSVKYFLNLVLIDEEDRRYFKQQEVVFWRKAPEVTETTTTGTGTM
jgi:vacuolar protein sorting-associated protein 26